jgi:hypothetical protein
MRISTQGAAISYIQKWWLVNAIKYSFETQRHRGTEKREEGRGKDRVGEGRVGFRLELAGSVNSVPPCFQSPRMRSWSVTLS